MSLQARLALGICVVIGVMAAGLSWWASHLSERSLTRMAIEEQNSAMRLAAHLLRTGQPNVEVLNSPTGIDRVRMPAIPDMGDHQMVDTVSRIVGGVATVFRFDPARGDYVRITTNVKRPDGSRAVGTVLGTANPVFAALRAGRVFHGEAVILGEPYFAQYVPIVTPDNQVNGILFVGVKKADIVQMSSAIGQAVMLGAAVMALIAGLAALLLTTQGLKPLGRLTTRLKDLSGDRLSEPAADQGRKDSFGEAARAVETLRQALIERERMRLKEQEAASKLRRADHLESATEELDKAVATSVTQVLGVTSALRGEIETLRHAMQQTAGQVTDANTSSRASAEGVRAASAAQRR